tara:strand:+ start:1466 stop:1663 length:198 start_codon:yes stop_codon:yes gene_type:complete
MSIIKELETEHFQERVDRTIKTFVRDMKRVDLEHRLISNLDDYYNHVASHEERVEFLKEHEDLPF